MKVGDLVRLMTEHYLVALPLASQAGQLAIIIEHNEAVCNPWKVMIMTGEGYWLKTHELELVE